jgi:hypothetical protein
MDRLMKLPGTGVRADAVGAADAAGARRRSRKEKLYGQVS